MMKEFWARLILAVGRHAAFPPFAFWVSGVMCGSFHFGRQQRLQGNLAGVDTLRKLRSVFILVVSGSRDMHAMEVYHHLCGSREFKNHYFNSSVTRGVFEYWLLSSGSFVCT
ncbi:hypothetical protein B0T19DRAFT_208778 [Cercophora scortea]|uniref:Uncharacterized protein n=1 Tax=Cercophora scortea TaxID=314031 RepID=A0AAE0IFZ4_9PEZI|nr:hypothetical protein B0T19DRAFT_208778 [Cercophora scortea]